MLDLEKRFSLGPRKENKKPPASDHGQGFQRFRWLEHTTGTGGDAGALRRNKPVIGMDREGNVGRVESLQDIRQRQN